MTIVTQNFHWEEFECKCGCKGRPPLAHVLKIQRVRSRCGFPFIITSGYRCPDYNEKVSSTGRDGPHTKGATDISAYGHQALSIIENALKEGFTGIGVKQKGNGRFIHLDDLNDEPGQPRPFIWSY